MRDFGCGRPELTHHPPLADLQAGLREGSLPGSGSLEGVNPHRRAQIPSLIGAVPDSGAGALQRGTGPGSSCPSWCRLSRPRRAICAGVPDAPLTPASRPKGREAYRGMGIVPTHTEIVIFQWVTPSAYTRGFSLCIRTLNS